MLVYLDALIDALRVRDAAEAQRLLAHPLARLLPDEVQDEARAFAEGAKDPLAAPMRAMQLRHQTAELLRDAPVADAPEPRTTESLTPPSAVARRTPRPQQMELPLSA